MYAITDDGATREGVVCKPVFWDEWCVPFRGFLLELIANIRTLQSGAMLCNMDVFETNQFHPFFRKRGLNLRC